MLALVNSIFCKLSTTNTPAGTAEEGEMERRKRLVLYIPNNLLYYPKG